METKKFIRRSAGVGAVLLLAAGLAACGKSDDNTSASSTAEASARVSPAAAEAAEQTVQVDASNFTWTLDRSEVKAGQPVTFEVHGVGGTHGFSIVGAGVSQMVSEGDEAAVTWTPDAPGTYTIKCNVMCGSGHGTMEATITVT